MDHAPSKPSSSSHTLWFSGCYSFAINRQHAVNRAGVLFRGLGRGRRPSGGPLIGDDLLQALDAVPGEGGYTVLTDPIDPQTAIFREHVD
jgi:hypothetical protein